MNRYSELKINNEVLVLQGYGLSKARQAKINKLVSHIRDCDLILDKSSHSPISEISSILKSSLDWPQRYRPAYILNRVANLAIFNYRIRSGNIIWNPIKKSYPDFLRENIEVSSWLDTTKHPKSKEVKEWLNG